MGVNFFLWWDFFDFGVIVCFDFIVGYGVDDIFVEIGIVQFVFVQECQMFFEFVGIFDVVGLCDFGNCFDVDGS